MVLVWDLSLVLIALSEPPFEPLLSAELKVLSFKTIIDIKVNPALFCLLLSKMLTSYCMCNEPY